MGATGTEHDFEPRSMACRRCLKPAATAGPVCGDNGMTEKCHRCGQYAEVPTIVCGRTPQQPFCDRIVVCLHCKEVFRSDPDGAFLRGPWPKRRKD